MNNILIIISVALATINLILILVVLSKNGNNNAIQFLKEQITRLLNLQDSSSKRISEEFRANREEIGKTSKENREELNKNIRAFTEDSGKRLDAIKVSVETRLENINEQSKKENKHMRETIAEMLRQLQVSFDKNVNSFNELQKEKFAQLDLRQQKLVEGTEKKLEEMKVIVDEKLQKTLNERLSQSFETVGKQLQAVQEGLGEMKNLATDVGGLKKVLSNVKMRGGFGEVQLSMLLENILAPSQYEANVATRPGSSERVEFAVKLPGKDNPDNMVYLPIDAKFPRDTYERLVNAHEASDLEEISRANTELINTIKKMAKDIRDKYVAVPHTTDFGIMFLPFEGIYAEVVRNAALLEVLQKDYKVVVTGPTTLAAILNSLQMGFRTLAIQQRSGEVWEVLGAVKTEFEKFGGLMEKAQGHIQTGLNQLDEVMGKRTRAINRKLKNVEALPEVDTIKLFENGDNDDADEDSQ